MHFLTLKRIFKLFSIEVACRYYEKQRESNRENKWLLLLLREFMGETANVISY